MQLNHPITPHLKRLVMARKSDLLVALQSSIAPRRPLEDLVAMVLGATNDGQAYLGPEWSHIADADFDDLILGEVNEELVPQLFVVAREDLAKYLDADELDVVPPGGPSALPVFVKDQGVYGSLVLPITEDVRRFLARRGGSGGHAA